MSIKAHILLVSVCVLLLLLSTCIRTIGEGDGCGGRSILAFITIVLLVEMFGFGTASFVLRIIDDLLLPIIFGC